MSDTIKQNIKLAIEEELEQNTYVPPSAGSSFIQPLEDGVEILPSIEKLERNNINSTLFSENSRNGMKSAKVSIGVEAKAGVSGAAPEYGLLIKSLLGDVDTIVADVTTKASGNTASVLQIENADISKFNVNDIVIVKKAGAYHISPISAVDTTTDTANITLLIAAGAVLGASVKIAKCVNYKCASSGHPSVSVTKFIEDAISEYAAGCAVSSMALENFLTSQNPNFKFSLEGMSYGSEVDDLELTPSYDSSYPPVIHKADMFIDGVSVECDEISLSIENIIAQKKPIQSDNGISGFRVSKTSASGSFNIFQQDDSIAYFTKFDSNTEFSLFFYAYNPKSTSGEYEEVIAFYLPKVSISEFSEKDQDGLLQKSLKFNVNKDDDGSVVIMFG